MYVKKKRAQDVLYSTRGYKRQEENFREVTFPFLRLHVQDGKPQMLALRFAVHAGLFPHCGRSAPAFTEYLDGVRSAQVKSVLAVLSAQGIGRFIELPDLFRFHRIFEKGVLDRGVGYEVEEDNARGPVDFLPVIELIEKFLQKVGKLQGIHGGPGKFCLTACHIEIVFLQKGDDLSGRQGVAPCLDTGRLHIS